MEIKSARHPVSRGEKFLSMFGKSVKTLRAEYETVADALDNTSAALAQCRSELNLEVVAGNKRSEQLRTSVAAHRHVKSEYDKAVLAYRHKQAELHALSEDLGAIREQMSELQSRYDLMCSAISSVKHESPRYQQFKALLNDSLLPFINRVNVVTDEAQQMMKIRAIDDELRLADSLSAFSSRTIVAVAGGFSSGKSSLITSLFADQKVSLPIGIEPVTAIPTYVFHSDSVAIRGYPDGGGTFEVSTKMYARLSHKYLEEFGFNLRDLLPFISLEVPMPNFRNIAFIDLPGYNPGERAGATGGDGVASDEFVTQGQALIWVIGLDSNGTIPRDDLEKLCSLSELSIPLYVVLNKADLRPEETLDEVLDQVTDELMFNAITYEGACAYSSESGGEIAFRERSLMDFLGEWNCARDTMELVANKLDCVLNDYEQGLLKDIDNRKTKASFVKALELNLLEIGALETDFGPAFDIDRYMKGESIGMRREESVDSVLATSSFYRLFSGIGLRQLSGDESTDDVIEEDLLDSVVGDERNDTRADLVNLIRDQLQELRHDYSWNQSESDLMELRSIRNQLHNLLNTI